MKNKDYDARLEALEKKMEYKEKRSKLTFGTYTKKLVTAIIVFCLFNIELSYILAILGKDSLSDVSNQLIITVLGTAVVYLIRAFLDSWSESKYGSVGNIKDSLDEKIEDIEEELGVIHECHTDEDTEDDNNDTYEEEIDDDSYGN